jgi:DNA-binding NarL/FixJ family response regulator
VELTDREWEVLEFLARRALDRRDRGPNVDLAVTVRRHVSEILKKLRVTAGRRP